MELVLLGLILMAAGAVAWADAAARTRHERLKREFQDLRDEVYRGNGKAPAKNRTMWD